MRNFIFASLFLMQCATDVSAQLPVYKNKFGMVFVQLPNGSFKLGASSSDADAQSNERPQVELTISKSVCIATTEVTQSQWLKVMNTRPWSSYKGIEEDDFPAANMRFAEAIEFCALLSQMDGNRYRLPTEAEWEYACRAGSETIYSFGESPERIDEFAWWGANSLKRPQRVATKKPNAFGLYDMHGNLSEFCQSIDLEAPGDPQVGLGTLKPAVKRGNSFAAEHETKLRCSFRETSFLDNDENSGFRVLLELHKDNAVQRESARSITNGIGMKMVSIKAGTFSRGADRSKDNQNQVSNDENPVRRITIRGNFFIGETEVTQRQWTAIMGSKPWPDFLGGAEFPAVYIRWEDAAEFCRRLGKREGKVYRLPTEAEWEYCCRGGADSVYSYGDDSAILSLYGWYNQNSKTRLNAVKSKKPNPIGLYDCHGNVSEWCNDWYDEKYYEYSPSVDPQGPERRSPSGFGHVIRGGSVLDDAKSLRSSARYSSLSLGENIGFRVVLEAN